MDAAEEKRLLTLKRFSLAEKELYITSILQDIHGRESDAVLTRAYEEIKEYCYFLHQEGISVGQMSNWTSFARGTICRWIQEIKEANTNKCVKEV